MIVCYAVTKNLYQYLPTVINSLLKNNDDIVEKIYLFIEDDTIDTIKNKKIEFININNYDNYLIDGSPNADNMYSKMIMYKLAVGKILPPTINKVLFLDVDTIVDGSLKELDEIDISNNSYIGVREVTLSNKFKTLYLNAGVLLMNLDIMRLDNNIDMLINYVNLVKLACPEQDTINQICGASLGELDSKYNYSITAKFCPNPIIWHWAGCKKAWNQDGKNTIWNKYYIEELK